MPGEMFEVRLSRPDNSHSWGFRLEGGADLPIPLRIQAVNPGGIAERSGLQTFDIITHIGGAETQFMSHEDAKSHIISSGNEVLLVVDRQGQTIWRPQVTPVGGNMGPGVSPDIPLVTNTSLAANRQDIRQIGDTHNATPVPFGGVVTQDPSGRVKKVTHSQFNSPMGLYPTQQVADGFQNRVQEAQGFGGGADEGSQGGPPGFRSVKMPTAGIAGPDPATLQQQSMYCGACNEFIKGVFIKVQNKIPMHPNCLKCSKCSVGLRNIGYFYLEGKLYCETHAKQVAKPPGPDMKPVASYQ